ncbi:MAG: 2-hydroxychromene-2-carboxylate isomerase [Myxococcota bacterium]
MPNSVSSPMRKIEFFFDCSSPWTYLAFHRIEQVARDGNAELEWRPILVGGVFNSVNDSVYEQRANPIPAKLRYYAKDLADWARNYGIRIGSPSVFPVNSVKAMRGTLVALDHDLLVPYARAVFEAYWGDDVDISQDTAIATIADSVGLEGAELLAKIRQPAYKARLRDNTDELIARGGFGSPTMFLDREDMYFGNDRLGLLADALRNTELQDTGLRDSRDQSR